MELYVDIADVGTVEAIAEYFPVDGFTTNPKILAKAKKPVSDMMAEYKEAIKRHNWKIFFQTTADTAEEMLAQSIKLREYFGSNFIVKLPAVKEGYKAVRLCKAEGITVTVTVVHSMMQALIAAKAGADYVAPYISHMDNLGMDSIKCVDEMIRSFKYGGYPCRVLGASFRTVKQIKDLAAIGCQSATIAPELFDALIAHPSTDQSMEGFRAAWEKTFDKKEISDLIPLGR